MRPLYSLIAQAILINRTHAVESDFGPLPPKSEGNRIQHPPDLGDTGGACVSPNRCSLMPQISDANLAGG